MSEDLWSVVCRLYAAPGVRDLCLGLQDEHGVDVPLLLAVVALWRRGVALDEARLERLRAATAAWQTDVVAPLRAARRALRIGSMPGAGLAVPAEVQADLKREVQAVELRAERRQLEAIAALTADWPPTDDPADLARLLRRLVPADAIRWAPLVTAAQDRGGVSRP